MTKPKPITEKSLGIQREILYRLRNCNTPELAKPLIVFCRVCDAVREGSAPDIRRDSMRLSYHFRSLVNRNLIERIPSGNTFKYYITLTGLAEIKPHLERLAELYFDASLSEAGGEWSQFKRQPRPSVEAPLKPYAVPSSTVPMGSFIWWYAHFFSLDKELDRFLAERGECLIYDEHGAAHLVSRPNQESETVNEEHAETVA